MYIYNKIAKSNNIIYHYCENNANSKNASIICDFSKSIYKDDLINLNISPFEVTVAWISKKSKLIEWRDETENIIDKNIIKHFIINVK